MNDQQRISAALERLFRTYPSQAKGDSEFEIARNRVASAKVYFDAVAPYAADDVEDAVQAFLTGSVPGHNAAFAPSAPQVGSACRRAMEQRLDIVNRARRLRPALPAPPIEHTDEERQRAKAKVAEFVASVSDDPADEATIAIRNARWAKVNARFAPPMDDHSVMERLLGYSVGSPESEREAS